MKYTFLSDAFYADFPHEKYEQMEEKRTRPYAHVTLDLNGTLFAIPLRSHIGHPYAYFTNKRERCGVDYSKAVVIDKEEYINKDVKVFLRKDEFQRLKGKDFKIKKQFSEYVELYKRAKSDKNLDHRIDILQYSTLQYFEKYIDISENHSENTEESSTDS